MARKRRGKGLMGDINLLGLDEFGQNPGISPITGALIGGGVAGGTAIALGHMRAGTMAADREFYGFAAGLGAAALLWFSGPSRARHASWGAAVGAFLAEGLPWLEKKLLGTVQLPAATAETATAVAQAVAPTAAGTAGFGTARIHALNGLGMRRQAGGHYLNGLGIPKVHALNGAGLGLATIAPQPQSVGTIPGVHGPAFAGTQLGRSAPVNLLGNPTAAGNQVSLLGGPQIHGLSAAYGATLLGGGRG